MKSGGTPKSGSKDYYSSDGWPFLSIDDMNNKYLISSKKFITSKALEETSTFLFEKENILFSIYATIGNISINKIDVALPQSILGIKVREKILNEYFYYLLCANRKKIIKMQQVGSQPNISLKIFQEIKLHTTNLLDEQQKIANFLSLLDKQINLYVRKLELSENLLEYINFCLYRDASKNKYVKTLNILTPRTSKPISTTVGYTPISIMLNGNGFKISPLRVVLSKNGRKYYERIPDDLIIGLQNFHNGSIGILPNNFVKPIMSNAIASFINNSEIPSIVIKHLLLSDHHQYYLKNIAEGTGQKNLLLTKF